MNREEMQMLGFEIVAYAGDARSKLLMLLQEVSNGNFENVESTMESVDELINHAHKLQTTVLQDEARGEDVLFSFTMTHGQDHLMTVITMKEMVLHMINLYERLGEK